MLAYVTEFNTQKEKDKYIDDLHHYGYDQVTNADNVRQTIGAAAGAPVESGTALTQNGTHSGNGGVSGNYYDSYTIVNELSLTDVTAVKHWNGDVELYPNSAAVVKVNLTRAAQNTQDTAFNADSANEKQIVYTDGTTNDSVIFDKLLVKDYDNNTYTYTVTEQTVSGYSTSYDKQNVSAADTSAANRTVNITNTPLKSSASFLKYDLTDLEKHGSESNFRLVTLPGAQFELWREFTGKSDKKISFTLTLELADETLHIVRANDSRLKGKVTLTKTSSATTTTVSAGDPLPGAKYELYTKSGTKLDWYTHTPDDATYRVKYVTDDTAEIAAANYTDPASGAYMTTGQNGTLTVEGLDWGDYYLLEAEAPVGFETPTGEEARVYFSVGRSNCGDTPQELSMTNDPQTAHLNITKHIDQLNVDAWGEPTFIFRIHKTANYDYANDTFTAITNADAQPVLTKTISPATPVSGGTGYEDATGVFDIEPGTYTVDEVRVARYAAVGNSTTTEISVPAGKVSGTTNTPTSAVFSVKPDGSVAVKFTNELKNYEKLSHVDTKDNRFNGVKALEVGDKDGLTPTPSVGVLYTVTVNKSDLHPALIRSDGTSEPITTAYNKLALRV